MNPKQRWLIVIFSAAAMAWMESSTVLYLRTLVDRVVPYQANPLPVSVGLGKAELVRELATLVMLATLGTLAGHSRRSRFGYFLVAFGVWDILYYVFLKLIIDWPSSIWEMDLLFLLPLPWWGPVLAPVLIALLMLSFGTLITQAPRAAELTGPPSWAWLLNAGGALLALYVFMADAIRTVNDGSTALRTMLPTSFQWGLFLLALLLLAAPLGQVFLQLRRDGAMTWPST